MEKIPLIVFDETLRDGEQQVGIFFNYQTKKMLAHLIGQTGVHYIDIMPVIDESEHNLLKELVAEGLDRVIVPLTMSGRKYIDQAKACGVKRILLFHAVSDRLLFLRDAKVRQSKALQNKTIDDGISQTIISEVRENMLKKVIEDIRYATSPSVGLEVDFGAEDASRADFDFLVQCILELKPYIGHFLLGDTLGVLTPSKTHSWILQLLQSTNNAHLGVHFHNDMGMALENTLQAVTTGASMISSTFRGIGERAGNVACEQVLDGLRVRFGIEVEGINYDAVSQVTHYLDQMGIRPALPYSKQTQKQGTGIHVHSLLQDKNSYSGFKYEIPEIWFGKYSGAGNFQYLFEKILQQPLSQEKYQRMRSLVKALSIKHERCFSSDEIINLYQQGVFDG
jgi:benzylmalate synthase